MARAVPDEWRSLLTQSRKLVARVDVLDADRTPILTTDPSTGVPLKVTDLSVTVDQTRTIRGSSHCVITVPRGSESVIPTTASAVLSPISGATFRVWAGFEMPSTGLPYLVPCGRYDIENCNVTETAAGIQVELEGEDLTGRLNVADFTAPWIGIAGSNKLDIAAMWITPVLPGIGIVSVPSNEKSGWVVLDVMANRLAELTSLMTSMGYEVFMDPDGFNIHLQPVPSTTNTPVWIYDESMLRVVPQIQNRMARARVYNGVVARGETLSSDIPPVRAEAWITDPTDPTHYDPGPPVRTNIGPRPYFLTSQYITTQDQAQNAANVQLMRIRGLLQQVSLTVGINPAINVGDVIAVTRPKIGVIGSYVVQSVSFNLAQPEDMQLVCEERRVVTAA